MPPTGGMAPASESEHHLSRMNNFGIRPAGQAISPYCFKINQRGVQWKQGVVIHMMIYTLVLLNGTTPLPLHPPPTAPPCNEYPISPYCRSPSVCSLCWCQDQHIARLLNVRRLDIFHRGCCYSNRCLM